MSDVIWDFQYQKNSYLNSLNFFGISANFFKSISWKSYSSLESGNCNQWSIIKNWHCLLKVVPVGCGQKTYKKKEVDATRRMENRGKMRKTTCKLKPKDKRRVRGRRRKTGRIWILKAEEANIYIEGNILNVQFQNYKRILIGNSKTEIFCIKKNFGWWSKLKFQKL